MRVTKCLCFDCVVLPLMRLIVKKCIPFRLLCSNFRHDPAHCLDQDEADFLLLDARVVAQHLVPQGVGHGGAAHRQPRVAGVRLVDRVDRQEADGVDAEGVNGG